MESVVISTHGVDSADDLDALSSWLAAEPNLRGLVEPVASIPNPGELGGTTEALVTALGAGGAISVLASSLKTFLGQPRGESVQIKVTRPDGLAVELSADRVHQKSVSELVALIQGIATDET